MVFVMYNGYLVVGDVEGYLYWVNIIDGCFVVQQSVDSFGFLSVFVVVSDKLLVQVRGGMVYVFIC